MGPLATMFWQNIQLPVLDSLQLCDTNGKAMQMLQMSHMCMWHCQFRHLPHGQGDLDGIYLHPPPPPFLGAGNTSGLNKFNSTNTTLHDAVLVRTGSRKK